MMEEIDNITLSYIHRNIKSKVPWRIGTVTKIICEPGKQCFLISRSIVFTIYTKR